MAEPWPWQEQDSRETTVVVRPAVPWGRYAVFGTVFALCIGLIAVGCTVLIRDPLQRNVFVGTCIAVLAFLLLGGGRLYLVSRLSSIRVDQGSLLFVNAVGFHRHIEKGRLAQILGASFDVSIRGSYTMRYWVFLDREGRGLFKLPQKWWPDDAVHALGLALAVPIGRRQEVLSGPDFRRAYPGSISWSTAHPRLAASIAGLSIFGAIIAVLILLSQTQGAS